MHPLTTAADNYGLLSRDQAVALLGEDHFEYELGKGRLIRVRPRVYVVAGAPASIARDLRAATMAADGSASHRSALWQYDIGHAPRRPEIVVPRGGRMHLSGIRIHESTYLPPHHLTVVRGIPTTTPARTAVDMSAAYSDERLGPLLDRGDRAGVWTYQEVKECFDELRARGRRRIAHLRPYLEARLDDFDSGDSDLEVTVRTWIIADGLLVPVVHLWVVIGGQRFCIDLAYPEWKVAIETDGWGPHKGRATFERDRDKVRALELAGWLVLPFTSLTPRHIVVRDVRAALVARGAL
ncbi:MAG: hypothetical protein QOJ09_986 [Actinomycetota bacterium]|nr:hypothetical protein [Actinomycetota bacterium]